MRTDDLNATWKRGDPIVYINPEIPDIEVPAYNGERYTALAPDTLDLQERAALAVHGLTAPTDEAADYEIYWLARFGHNPPVMQHDWSDAVQCKFMEALPLLRIASGSNLNAHVEQRWTEALLQMQGPDGLLYFPKQGRPWWRMTHADYGPETPGEHYTMPYANGRLLNVISIYYLRSGKDALWRQVGERVVDGLTALAVDHGDYVTFDWIQYAPDHSYIARSETPGTHWATWLAWAMQGTANFYRTTGYEPARALSRKIVHWLIQYGDYYAADGAWRPDHPGRPYQHFHGHTMALLGALDYGLAANDGDVQQFVRRGFEYGMRQGESLIGYFPEWLGLPTYQTCELCEVADMIALGLKLSAAGLGDYWDDVDRWLRNQFAEAQLRRADWAYRVGSELPPADINPINQTSERVPERNLGAFAGWMGVNDWYGSMRTADWKGHAFMHCCTGNSTRALYYIWDHILTYTRGKLQVNLLLNRASPWLDVDSHIPYVGQVDVKVKQALELAMRIPEWVRPAETRVTVNGRERRVEWAGRYAEVGQVQPGDVVSMIFPIAERSDTVHVQKERYTLVRKGNEVVCIDPPGRYCPLYQRDHYRENGTRWRKIERFVSNERIRW